MSSTLSGRLAVVTGASEGIGKAVAMALARQGCTVALLARSEHKLKEVAASIHADGGKAWVWPCDLSNSTGVRSAIRAVQQACGDIDILVNNVGAGTFKPLDQTSEAECDLAIAMPFMPAVVATHEVVKGMVARKRGHIVNLTSPAGILPLPYMAPYTAARHAMVGLSHALHEELHPQGIGVSLVCPSQVNTGYFERNDADMRWYPKISKLFPVLAPETVGEVVVDAILRDRREVIHPWTLWLAITAFRLMPATATRCLKWFKLWH